jgi:hypothetical protein
MDGGGMHGLRGTQAEMAADLQISPGWTPSACWAIAWKVDPDRALAAGRAARSNQATYSFKTSPRESIAPCETKVQTNV